jgi:hypothetical protein
MDPMILAHSGEYISGKVCIEDRGHDGGPVEDNGRGTSRQARTA